MPASAARTADATAAGNSIRLRVAAVGIQTFDTVRCRALCLAWATLAMLRNFRMNPLPSARRLAVAVLAAASSCKSGGPAARDAEQRA